MGWEDAENVFFLDSRPKRMKIVLQEQGVDTYEMKAADMQLALGNHADFKTEKIALEYLFVQEKRRLIHPSQVPLQT